MTYNPNLEQIAYVDELTKLRNRNGLMCDRAEATLDNEHFILVDIDEFKKMNTVFGIDAVDRILVIVSRFLLDYCGNSSVYRIGAGQFLLVTDSHIHCEPSELQRLLRQPIVLDDLQIVVSASICVLDHDDFPTKSLKNVVKLMQLTLDVEKKKGKNVLVYATEEKRTQYYQKRDIALSLFSSVKNKDFYPLFKPFVDTYTNEIIGIETVSRWNLNGEILRPVSFLDAAEWTGLIYDIELQMFEESVKFFSELRSMTCFKGNKSINCAKRFKAAVHFSAYTLKRVEISKLLEILEHYGIPQTDMIIQTREKFIVDPEAYEKIKQLHDYRFMVALDDYTNTSASLPFLADLKVDIISLSEQLLENIDNNQEFTKMKNVYKFLVNIAKQFDITVISDGINSAENAKLIRDLDVHIGIGRHYTRALQKEDFIEYMNNNKIKRFR